jgi:uncharacterized protein
LEKETANALEMATEAHEERKTQTEEKIMVGEPLAKELFDVLACPTCKGDVVYNDDKTSLVCSACKVEYPIKDGIPVMLPK